MIGSKNTEHIRQEKAMAREIFNFNKDWGFYRGDLEGAWAEAFDDSAFARVTVPHSMRLEKKHNNTEKGVYKGIGWYRRYFTVEEAYQDKRVELHFEGVMTDSDVYLNGEKIYTRNGGYIGFTVDITEKVKFGEMNVLAVRVSNEDSPNTPPGKPDASLDFHYYGGIYRDVTLTITEKTHITDVLAADKTAGGGILLYYTDVSDESASLQVKTHVENANVKACTVIVKQILKDADREIAAAVSEEKVLEAGENFQFSQEMEIREPELWSVDHPHLYHLVTEVYEDDTKVDEVITKTGVRTIAYKPDGFYLNGERIYLRGANRHQCYQNIGDAAPKSMQYRDALQIKQNGFNAVRATHYPQDKAFLDACDELGILVIECQPGWQNFTKTDIFYERTIRDTREMIRRDRNRPSVILWESSLNETRSPENWAQDAVNAAHEEYPGDQLFTAADYGYHGELYDVCYKVQDTQWSDNQDEWEDYDPEKPFFTREWGDFEEESKALRKDGEAVNNLQIYTRQRYLNGNGYSDWGGLDASDRIGGYFLWSWNDYARGSIDFSLGSGTVDIDRYEKDCYYWFQSMLGTDNKEYGPMVYISSAYTEQSSLKIPVFSNCESVKLYQNGTLVKELTREEAGKAVPNIMRKGGSPIFEFELEEFIPGTLKAEGIENGQAVCRYEVKTPGQAVRLELEVRERGISPIADGSDLVPVYVKAVDVNGTIVPDYAGIVSWKVDGEGSLVGAGIPRIKVENQTLEGGIGFAFIRTSESAGTITVTVSADKLEGTAVEITTKECEDNFVPDGSHQTWSKSEAELETEAEMREAEAIGEEIPGSVIEDDVIASIEASEQSAEGRGTDKLRDGVTTIGTGWLSTSKEFPQSVTVEFKTPQTVSGSRIHWEKDSSWYTYDLEVSCDGENWEKVISDLTVGGQHFKPETFEHVQENVLKVRVVIKNIEAGGDFHVGMAEWMLYGAKTDL